MAVVAVLSVLTAIALLATSQYAGSREAAIAGVAATLVALVVFNDVFITHAIVSAVLLVGAEMPLVFVCIVLYTLLYRHGVVKRRYGSVRCSWVCGGMAAVP